jgi:RNA polymerase sigma factor (sigma-70 family)
MNDDRLASRAAAGDERAFAAIFERYHQSLYRYCLAIVGDSEEAQDALQNTMFKMMRALPGEKRRIDLKPWLYRIAHNESIELLRRRREASLLDADLAAAGPGLAEEVASRERLRGLISDLDELPERQRGTLVMRELGGLEFAEIGAALDTSPAVARQALYEARLSLRQMDEGREMSCATVTKALSDGDGRVTRRRDIRAHLRACPDCRSFRDGIKSRERDFAALSPLPAVAAAGVLQAVLGGNSAGAGASGLVGALGGGTAKSLGASAALKGAATVAVVAAIGAGAADRSGLVDLGLPGGDGSAQPARVARPAGVDFAPPSARAADAAAVGVAAGLSRRQGTAGHLGASTTAKAGAGETTSSPAAAHVDSEATPNTASHGKSTAHAHGKGHEKQLPAASAHGQETAATHKATPASPGGKSHPPHPTHPSHPGQPSNPGTEKGSAASPPTPSVAEEALPQGKGAADKP